MFGITALSRNLCMNVDFPVLTGSSTPIYISPPVLFAMSLYIEFSFICRIPPLISLNHFMQGCIANITIKCPLKTKGHCVLSQCPLFLYLLWKYNLARRKNGDGALSRTLNFKSPVLNVEVCYAEGLFLSVFKVFDFFTAENELLLVYVHKF